MAAEMARETEKSVYGVRRVHPDLIPTKIVQVQPMQAPVGGVAFYRARYGSTKGVGPMPAGGNPRFKVKTIAALQRIYATSDYALSGYFPRKEAPVAGFGGENFEIIDGLGIVQTGRHEVEGLSCNEAYEEFLLSLTWGSPLGWISPLHVLAMSSDDEIEEISQDGEEEGEGAPHA